MLDKSTQKGQLPVSASQIAEKKKFQGKLKKKKLKRILKREKFKPFQKNYFIFKSKLRCSFF
jgi:hypothetical protein